ncbi:DUF3108 domain-containing protein [Candidatus Latescibacterota bacterium]
MNKVIFIILIFIFVIVAIIRVSSEYEATILPVKKETDTVMETTDNDNAYTSSAKEVSETDVDLVEVNSVDEPASNSNENNADNEEKREIVPFSNETSASDLLADNNNSNIASVVTIAEIYDDSTAVNSIDKDEYISYSKEKSIDDKDFLSIYAEQIEDTLLVTIPEWSWPDTSRIRRNLTLEVAKNYPSGNYIQRKIVNKVWGVGEQLTFSIDYGFFRAGTATMAVVGTEEVNGGLCYHIKTEAKSNKFISTFYKVRDRVSSYIDVEGIFSRRFEKILREGKYKSDRFVDFYHDRLIALNTTEKYAIKEIPLYTQDILSSLYLLRTFDLEVGKDETIDVYADGKVYPLKVIVHTIEKVKVPAGEFECFKVEPVLQSEGIFRQKGRLIVWLTNDELKLPVKMASKVIIGYIGSNLEKYSSGEI